MAAKDEAAPAPLGEAASPVPPARPPSYRGPAIGLAVVLVVVLALVGTAPFWAPLLPWDDGRAAVDPAIVERLDADQRKIRLLQQETGAVSAALPQIEQRMATLEQKPAPPSPDLGEIRRQMATNSAGISDLTARLERLETWTQTQGPGIADLKNGLDRLETGLRTQTANVSDLMARLDRAEQAQQAQAAGLAGTIMPLEQGLRAQQSATAALAKQLQSLEHAERSRAGDLTDVGLTLALLQIRGAVEDGRPFSAEYDALSSLAKAKPEIAASAAPLAAAAGTGVANRAALGQELRALKQKIGAAPAEPGSGGGWIGAALDRLRGLVRIRRAEEAEPGKEADAAITVAERALAGGDLARAVAAVETLQGPAAAMTADWLRKARERLAVEGALRRLEALLTGRLGDTVATPDSSG